MDQGQILIAKTNFGFRSYAKGRPVQVRKGQRFWVTSTKSLQTSRGAITIDREGRGSISNGYHFAPSQISEFFETAK
jgi:hypothetical protein